MGPSARVRGIAQKCSSNGTPISVSANVISDGALIKDATSSMRARSSAVRWVGQGDGK